MKRINQAFFYLYSALFFLIPLVFFTKTSELFEFNKIVVTYFLTILIAFAWGLKIIITRKFEFKKTILFWPIIIFVVSQILSTLVSIDIRTSILGYYSRFNGGLLSTLSYSFLYFAFINNIDKKQVEKLIFVILFSTLFVSIYGIFEHFGKSFSCVFVTGNFDVDCWVQDVQLRIFATFGQPNWLAAWLVAVTPFTWNFLKNNKNDIIFHSLTTIFFITLLFTKSRSGIMAFGIMFAIYWGITFWTNKKNVSIHLKQFLTTITYFLIAILIIGTPWTPNLSELSNKPKQNINTNQEEIATTTVLESGGTESGDIRKIVWQGALNTWKLYPLLGSGVETFAFSYYQGRPAEHNKVSEWNYIYNKAHNEYLNFLATTGIVGITAYAILILISLYLLKDKAALLAGFVSILITNFFGFSVVPIAILFFLFPAIAIAQDNELTNSDTKKLDNTQNFFILVLSLITGYLLLSTINYWRADYYYSQGKNQNRAQIYPSATVFLAKAINLVPNEPLYHSELASSYAEMAIINFENNNTEVANLNITNALNETNKAYILSPKNTNILRAKSNVYSDLAYIDRSYLNNNIDTLLELQKMAPTDVSVVYKIGLAYARGNQIETSIDYLNMAIEMKPDYKRARQVLAALYQDTDQNDKAREQYEYILKYISPDDKTVQNELEQL